MHFFRSLIAISAAALMLSCPGLVAFAQTIQFNEFRPDPPGAPSQDPGTYEIIGMPGMLVPNFQIIQIEGDPGGANPGDINNLFSFLNSGQTFDSNGLFTVNAGNFESPSFTLVLTVTSTSLTLSSDVDADDNGAIDNLSVFGDVQDAITVLDLASDSSLAYALEFGGVEFPFTGTSPELMFRDRLTREWYAVNNTATDEAAFNEAGQTVDFAIFDSPPDGPTFGAVNPSRIPEPGALSLTALTALGLLAFRRRRANLIL